MAGAQDEGQKAPKEKASAAEPKPESQPESAGVTDAPQLTTPDSEPEPEPALERYVVTGPVVVLPTVDGSERYVYRHAPVDSGAFTQKGLDHALSIGLIARSK